MKFLIALFLIVSSTLADDEHFISTNAKIAFDMGILTNQLNQLKVKFDEHELLIKNQQTEINQLKKKNLELAAGEIKIVTPSPSGSTFDTIEMPDPRHGFKPSSCAGLSHLGHTLNGFYNVESETGKHVSLVYCDFTKKFKEAGFETRYGSVRVKSNSVHFLVTRNTSLVLGDGPITYNVEKLNVGGGMDLEKGVFTAPIAGIYSFTFKGSAIGEYRFRDTTGHSLISLNLNGVPVSAGYSRISNADNAFIPISLHATLQLKKGDRIAVFAFLGDFFPANFFSSDYTQFMGSLLEEDVTL